MKLLTQGDDFGFTKAVTYGIIDAIEHGVLRNTGLFTNMPDAVMAAAYIRNNDRACFGIDFNIVSGKPVSDPKDIPDLVDENGEFIRSGARQKDARWQSEAGRDAQFPFDQVYRELKAQYERFLLLVGKKPGYLHPHSIMPENYLKAIRVLSEETGVVFSMDIHKKLGFKTPHDLDEVSPLSVKKVFDPMAQLNKDPLGKVQRVHEYLEKSEYVMIGGHPGFVDSDLLGLTTLSLERVKDHQMMVSTWMKEWIKKNNIELITYDDLTKVA